MILENLCSTSKESDEVFTPFYAVEPILEFIPEDKVIWCPFDHEWSAFVQLLKARGNEVVFSHIENGKDFFSYEPPYWDMIISNPPFSKKDKILRRCFEFGKPFALLLPVKSIQGKARVAMFEKYGIELLVFGDRVNYHTRQDYTNYREGNHFGSFYICHDLLPDKLVFKTLQPYQKALK